ncbi:MAG: NADH:ubiquinone reductase (Na(+)-transporting) subunit B [candidate division KSB1 bacterium]|nr:NADH:ubiquinone reductase (Na(+)-transporting) subunit B [candidate division KSB1 bacterium]
MKLPRSFLDKQARHFQKGGKLERLHPLYEAVDTILFTTAKPTPAAPHVRDALDMKRAMITVVYALVPCTLMALYNTGYQANLALSQIADVQTSFWQTQLMMQLGVAFDPANFWANVLHGALFFLPVYIVTIAVGGFWEVLFAVIRKHEINEGFLVTSLLFPLISPPTLPYWQIALGVSFGVVIGKEVFGGVGMNIFNPALTARAFLFFAYPAQISGDKVWVAVDGLSQATALAQLADPLIEFTYTWKDAFIGLIPGSMGETSVIAALIGAFILIVTRIGSWRIMLATLIGLLATALFFNWVSSDTNPMFNVSPWMHLVFGGYAFGAVFMATDPVSATMTTQGKWIYGLLIGVLVIMVRVINPAFPEGMMLAILFMNVFSPIIDRIFINRNIKRRQLRHAE